MLTLHHSPTYTKFSNAMVSRLHDRVDGSHLPDPIQALIRPQNPPNGRRGRNARHRTKRLHTAPAGSKRPGQSVSVARQMALPKRYHAVEKSLRSPFETALSTHKNKSTFDGDGFWHNTKFPAARPASRDDVRELEKVFRAMLADLESNTRTFFVSSCVMILINTNHRGP